MRHYGYEHDGNLYVVYSIGKEDCGLSVLPIESLEVREPIGHPCGNQRSGGTSAG